MTKPDARRGLLRRLLRTYLQPHWAQLLLAFVAAGVSAAMTFLVANLMQPIFDTFIARESAKLIPIAGAAFVVFGVRGIASYIQNIVVNRLGQRVVADIQRDTYDRLIEADLSVLHGQAAGALVTRMTADVNLMRYAVVESVTNAGKNTVTLIALVGLMFWKDWYLSTVAFLIFPLTGLYVSRLGKRLRKVSTATQVEQGRFASLLVQTFQNAKHVKASGAENFEKGRVEAAIDRLFRLNIRAFRISALGEPVTELASGLAVAVLIVVGGSRIADGHLTTGGLVAFVTAFLLAYEPMKRLSRSNAILQQGLAAAERLFELIDVQPTIVDAPTAQPLAEAPMSVELDRVSFAYAEGRPPSLHAINLHVPAGKTVALVGASGAGKTTILSLIPRLYDPADGIVRVAGQDVRGVTLQSLRHKIALVSQEIAIFDDTIAANIAYATTQASQAQIEDAARAAAAHDFIQALPDGYQTMVGENGVKLSGGQRQRLAIARAILRDAPILLLDEATSALDTESERAVQAALQRLRTGRTTLVVAHRLSTVVEADRIVVLEAGRVVEQGTHAELVSVSGVYARLYGTQLQAATG
ncbi:ABC transporter ATP-binding protein [Roseiterribacter gracilis]|uniref:ABC transporter permease n=1 Tax=Roseiterribacter gracilis TaxID=2812848 RepID=A0A8S8X6I2_9PROT|nr:ABC transporter permease [Rhodospirillales bacterium TMPK1]